MNKETRLIQSHIESSGYCLDRIDKLRKKHANSKNFFNEFGYLVMEILNEKKFINVSRKNIDLPILSDMYFTGGQHEKGS